MKTPRRKVRIVSLPFMVMAMIIYNKPPGRKPGGRKTMLFDDYMGNLELTYPGEARRISEKTRPVTEY